MLNQGLRAADLVELEAAGFTAEEALTHGYSYSKPFCMTIAIDGHAVAMFGVADDLRFPHAKAGLVWLLGTEGLLKVRTQFLRESRKWLDLITQDYNVVGNYVHRSNTVHIQWLKWLGFSFIEETGPFISFARIPCAAAESKPKPEGDPSVATLRSEP